MREKDSAMQNVCLTRKKCLKFYKEGGIMYIEIMQFVKRTEEFKNER